MQQFAGVVSYSTTLLSTKRGNEPEPNPLAASLGIRTVWTSLSHQLISIAAMFPHEMLPSAEEAVGTVTVRGLVVLGTRFTCRSGLSPAGLVCCQNSALRNTLTYCPVPTFLPPHVYALVLKIGEFNIRATELEGAHESATVGLKVSPLVSFTTTGTITVVTLAAPFAWATN